MADIERRSLVEQVAEMLCKYIETEDIPAGTRLSSEKELCERYQVSRTTIRESLRLVQALGYIRLEPNKGALVEEKSRRGVQALRTWVLEYGAEAIDVYEVRMLLEPQIAALAAKRGTDEEKYMIVGSEARFNEAVRNNDMAEMLFFDEQFHAYIAKASHNALLIEINRIMAEAIKDYRVCSFAAEADIQHAKNAHELLSKAIMCGDSAAASALMADHLRFNADVIASMKQRED